MSKQYPQESRHEQARRIRGYGEAGWEFGWDVNSLRDQFAFLGEMVSTYNWMLQDHKKHPDLWAAGQKFEQEHPDDVYDDTTYSPATIRELEERILEHAWTLNWLQTFKSRERGADLISRQDWLDAEVAYDTAHPKDSQS